MLELGAVGTDLAGEPDEFFGAGDASFVIRADICDEVRRVSYPDRLVTKPHNLHRSFQAAFTIRRPDSGAQPEAAVIESPEWPHSLFCQTQYMRMVVTGAAGFVGFHMTRRLTSDGHDVLAVDSFEDNYSVDLKWARWDELLGVARTGIELRQRRLDLCDYPAFSHAVKDFSPDVILHFAARPGVREGVDAWPKYSRSNLTGLSSVLSAATEAPSSPVLVYASSSSVYGGSSHGESSEQDQVRPISFYGATKVAGEQLAELAAKTQGLTAVGLRMFTVYGPWGRPDMLPWRLVRATQTGQPLPLYGDGSARRDFTYIDDVVESVVRIAEYSQGLDCGSHQVFNIGGGHSVSVREAIHEVEAATGRDIKIKPLSMNKSDVSDTLASIEKLTSTVGFAPTIDFGTGIRMTIPWFESASASGQLSAWDS